MQYITHYQSPLGGITISSDGTALTGLWFDGQKYFASTLGADYKEEDLPVFTEAKRWLDIYFSGREPDFTPPLALNGSAFRMAVWQILQSIPYGKTITYGDIARQLAAQQGKARISAQAVGGVALTHPFGCSQLGDDHERTAQLLASLVRNPNAGGVLVVGLGCENNTLESFQARLGDVSLLNLRVLQAQEERDEFAAGLRLLEQLEKAGREDLLVAGFDADAELIEAMREGRLWGTICQNPRGMGYAAVTAALRASAGMPVDPSIDTGYVWLDQKNYREEKNQIYRYDC